MIFFDKDKKKEQIKKNRRTQIIVQHAKQHQEELEAAAAEAAAAAARADRPEGSEIQTTAMTTEVLNKISRHRRRTKERWNRFAGTASAGARGL